MLSLQSKIQSILVNVAYTPAINMHSVTHFSFSWGWFWSPPPVYCYELTSIVLQALCLLDQICWIYSLLPLYNHKEFDLGHKGYNSMKVHKDHNSLKEWVVFPTFFNLSLNFAIRSSWSESHSQSAPGLVFTDRIELLHLPLQRM